MALSNFSELQSAISNYIMRSDAPVDTFIKLAESDIAPYVKHYLSEKLVTLTSTDGAVSLPDDFSEARTVRIDGVLATPVSAFNAALDQCEFGYFQSGATHTIVPPSETPRTVELAYYGRVPALSATTPTNWLLTNFPAILFHATLARAYRWLKDPDAEELEKASLAEAMALLAKDHSRAVNSGNPISVGGQSW